MTRDAVEAALSDVILLGTQEQVRLAVQGRAAAMAPSAWARPRHLETEWLAQALRCRPESPAP